MAASVTNVAVLGSTGSIGRNALEVIAASGSSLSAVALAAHRSTAVLEEQARRFCPAWVVAADPESAAKQDWSGLPASSQLLVGAEALERIVADPQVDIVLSAIVGSVGLQQHVGRTGCRQDGGVSQ